MVQQANIGSQGYCVDGQDRSQLYQGALSHILILSSVFIFQCVEDRTVPDVELPGLENIPVNQSKVPKPEKSVLIAKQQTRLNIKEK